MVGAIYKPIGGKNETLELRIINAWQESHILINAIIINGPLEMQQTFN